MKHLFYFGNYVFEPAPPLKYFQPRSRSPPLKIFQSILEKKWYSLFQNEYCNFLKVITHKTFHEIGKPISHAELLMPYNLRNFYHTHVYLGLSRLNSVFMTSKPSPLYNDLIECLKSSVGEVIQPYTGYKNIDCEYISRLNRRNFYFLQNIGKYGAIMKNSPFLDKELNKFLYEKNPDTGKKYPKKIYNEFLKRTEEIWPICFIKLFNELPFRIRSMFGTYGFKRELKIYFNQKCQHPYDPNRVNCKRCSEKDSFQYKEVLNNRRIFYKFCSYDQIDKFYKITDQKQLFVNNLIMYHHQFQKYFLHKGYLPDINMLIETHGLVYKDFFPELHISKFAYRRILI